MIRMIRFGKRIAVDLALSLAALALTILTGRRHRATWYGKVERRDLINS